MKTQTNIQQHDESKYGRLLEAYRQYRLQQVAERRAQDAAAAEVAKSMQLYSDLGSALYDAAGCRPSDIAGAVERLIAEVESGLRLPDALDRP